MADGIPPLTPPAAIGFLPGDTQRIFSRLDGIERTLGHLRLGQDKQTERMDRIAEAVFAIREAVVK